MSDNNNSYRIRTNVGEDSVLNVNINQDFNALEVLSLKLDVDNLYKLHTSNYGCVVGRVLANGGYGIPNAKISIFISADSADLEDDVLSYLYPYKSVSTKNRDKIRYNLLPEDQLSDCHRNVGTFPSKRTVLDDNNMLEVYDKYYKFTTRTNESGDYMIFGVPVGEQTLHVDIDLSDIGILSQHPRDMVYKGYNITQFENANMFKSSTDLDSLAQVISQNQNVNVYPFWGEESEGNIAITRRDIDIQYEFTPTCVFIGSVVTDEPSNSISKRCIPSEKMGKMDELVTGNGTIEMIRKTPEGGIEEFIIQGNALIDGDGVWCYQIPMNLDYVRTDEYGNTVRTDDSTKGIPTRASVRFRFSLTEFENEGSSTHVSKVLVPNNPKYYDDHDRKKANDTDASVLDYVFGSETDDASFKDLFSNNVYTVKSFIPRFQMLNLDRNKRFSGFKAINDNEDNNPIPYNNIRVELTFMFTLQCAVFKVLIWVVGAINSIITVLSKFSGTCSGMRFDLGGAVIGEKESRCLYIGEGYCPEMEGWYFAPKCGNDVLLRRTYNLIRKGDLSDSESIDEKNRDTSENGNRVCVTTKLNYFIQCVEINLAMEYDVIQLDFYNDWINGMLYVPRWQANIRKKRTFFFGLINISPRLNACLETGYFAWFQRRYAQQCSLMYTLPENSGTDYTDVITPKGCKNNSKQKCHKSKGRRTIRILDNSTNNCKPGGGVVHGEQTLYNKYAYYFRPCEWLSGGRKCNLFATDIVLLGSMEENNSQGIPQTFTRLGSTSYQIPDALASTNLGVDGYLYGAGPDDAVCNGPQPNSEAFKMDSTFESVEKWTKGKDSFEVSPYDKREEPVTETSGIDWGYSGPNQGDNDLSNLYFPGGHFLGVSCFNTETNIKSCVNLSRICEAGSMMSQRQAVVYKPNAGNNDYEYIYLSPTGFISGESINDYGFKNEFATLNYNGLKTKLNKKTLLREYDFESINPVNFSGELRSQIKDNQKYNERASDKEYRRAIEENSHDYYRFRLGLPKEYTAMDAKKKYLISESGAVSLPVYENSFYFYFGLNGGNTAIDKFYKEYFAECPSLKSYDPSVTVEVNSASTLCENIGIATVKTRNIENIKIDTSDGDISTIGNGVYRITGLPGNKNITIKINGSNITEIEKTFIVSMNLPSSIENISYNVENYKSEYIDLDSGVTSGYIEFNGEPDMLADSSVAGIVIYTSEFRNNGHPYAKVIRNANYTGSAQIDISDYEILSNTASTGLLGSKIYVWSGNKTYTIRIFYDCGGNLVDYELPDIEILMPEELDIRFGGDRCKYASYRYLVKPLLERYPNERNKILSVWYNIILDSQNSSYDKYRAYLATLPHFANGYTNMDEVAYYIEKAIFYQNSQSASYYAGSELKYEIVGGVSPYKIITEGDGEKIEYENGDNSDAVLLMEEFTGETAVDEAENSGYSLSTEQFISPTTNSGLVGTTVRQFMDAPVENSYFQDYMKYYPSNGVNKKEKKPYTISVIDADGSEIRGFTIPSIYRPFFFRALYLSLWSAETEYSVVKQQAFSIGVANGVSEPETIDGTKVEKIEIKYRFFDNYGSLKTNTVIDTEHKNYYGPITANASDGNIEKEYYTKAISGYTGNRLITDGDYSIFVRENGENGIKIERNIKKYFIGDIEGYYDPSVRYIPVNEDFAKMITNFMDSIGYPSIVPDRCAKAYGCDVDEAINRACLCYGLMHDDREDQHMCWDSIYSSFLKDWSDFRDRERAYWLNGTQVTRGDELKAQDIFPMQDDDGEWIYGAEKKLDDGYGFVIGIYDSDYDYDGEEPLYSSGRIAIKSANSKHISTVTIMRIYNKNEFLYLLKNNFPPQLG